MRVGLDQIARLYAEVENSERFAICKSHAEIVRAREAGKIALLITMEGVEPLGADLDFLRVFYELGVRVIGLTHARRNAAASGGVFAASGSSPEGLTAFGRDLVRECEALGMIIDLAHINPAASKKFSRSLRSRQSSRTQTRGDITTSNATLATNKSEWSESGAESSASMPCS